MCPGPSIITCTFLSQALFVSSPNTISSLICEASVASAIEPGLHASPKLKVKSYFSHISNNLSKYS